MAEIPPIFKAKVSTLDGSTASVLPLVADGVVTRPFPIHFSMRGGMCPLTVGDEVVCAKFADGTGIVLCRADGEWSASVPTDVTIGGVSFKGHTHTGVHGETGTPH